LFSVPASVVLVQEGYTEAFFVPDMSATLSYSCGMEPNTQFH